MTTFAPRFSPSPDEVSHWAARYAYDKEPAIERDVAPAARARGYLTHAELAQLGHWKSPRIRPRLAANDPEYVTAVTAVALSTTNERLRIEGLTLLSGVAWPMASTILHWCHADPYPILDFRALWSLGIESPPRYDFPFWQAYTAYCRELARQAGVTMRMLDRALWQYSNERRPKK